VLIRALLKFASPLMKTAFLPDLDLTTILEYVQFFERLRESLFTLKDAGLVSKLFQDWQKAGFWYQPYARRSRSS
jgi:hypothetical protein